jgi:hypothetical protein
MGATVTARSGLRPDLKIALSGWTAVQLDIPLGFAGASPFGIFSKSSDFRFFVPSQVFCTV